MWLHGIREASQRGDAASGDVVRPDCLIGLATSGIPRAEIAVNARHPARCFVNHPFFPAWRTLPIEVVLSGDEGYWRSLIRLLAPFGCPRTVPTTGTVVVFRPTSRSLR